MPSAAPQGYPAQPGPTSRPWILRHWLLTGIAAVIVVIIIAVAASSGGNSKNDSTAAADTGGTTTAPSNSPTATPSSTQASPAKATHYSESELQAVGAARDYLSTQSFSRRGLIQQLDSKDGSGFAKKDAVFAVNHITVNWNQQAYKAAKEYLATEHFSRDGLIEQLDSPDGSEFTKAQAAYAVNHVGL